MFDWVVRLAVELEFPALIVPTSPMRGQPIASVQLLDSEASCALSRGDENVVVEVIVIPELELRNVKMQVFLAQIIQSTNDTSLEDAPEALNRVGMHRANDVLAIRNV
jgi:hypothetical protein